jgi:glycerol kinase
MPFVLALDEGTTSARAALYDQQGRNTAMESAPLESHFPQPGWVEQDADAIWNAQLYAARLLLDRAGVTASQVAAAGITNQRETTVVWERATGRPVAPAIVWQCRRTAPYCAELARSAASAEVTRQTGLVIDAYFSASKIRWILDNTPDAAQKARDGELLFGNVDTWLIWKLTNGAVHVTDCSNASRTMLMNLETGEWDDGLLRLFDVPRAMLPRIVASSAAVGLITPELFGAEIPIAGIAGDQQAALAGQACFRAGLSKNTYGTGCFALMHTGARRPVSRHRLLATRAASGCGRAEFAIEGSVFVAGAAVQWLRDRLGLIHSAAESEALAASVANTGGVYAVPAFVGLGAPHWDAGARGILCGLTRSSDRAHIVRAVLESIAYQTRELVDAMQADAGERISELRVDGGASANNLLMQFQADVLDCPIVRPVDIETTALGAAYLAGLATGFWKDTTEVEGFWRAERRFEPAMDAATRDRLFSGWREAVARARSEARAAI